MLIALNAVCLAIYDYNDRESATRHNRTLDIISDVLTSLFLLESIIKIIAMGFVVHHLSYLRDSWNLVDFIIVLTG